MQKTEEKIRGNLPNLNVNNEEEFDAEIKRRLASGEISLFTVMELLDEIADAIYTQARTCTFRRAKA